MKNIKIAPSVNGYVTARTAETRLTDENCRLILNDNIDSIEHVWLAGRQILFTPNIATWDIIETTTDDADATNIVRLYDLYVDGQRLTDLDLTEYFVEAQDYATLEVPKQEPTTQQWYDGLNKANTCYWTRGGNEIVLCTDQYKGWFLWQEPTVPVYTAIYSKLAQLARGNAYFQVKFQDGVGEYSIRRLVLTPEMIGDTVTLPTQVGNVFYKEWGDVRALMWRIEYTAQSTVKLHSVKQEITDAQFTMPYNQQQEMVSAKAMGKYGQSLADRTGVPTKQIMRTVYNTSQLRPVGAIYKDGKDVWRLTSVTTEVVGKVINVVERWAKNWSNQSQFVGVNRQARTWAIPNKTVLREIRLDEYLFISDRRHFADDTILNANGVQAVMAGLWAKQGNKPVDCLWLFKSNTDGVIINVCSFGYGNSIVINGATKDNLSAGFFREIYTGEPGQEFLAIYYMNCREALYCNQDGTLPTMWLQFGSEIANLETNKYPLSEVGVNEPQSTITDRVQIDVDKDASEQIGVTYQLHFVTDIPEFIIGSAWASGNFITSEYKEYSGIKVWGLTRPLPKGVQSMTDYYGEVIGDWASYYSIDTTANHTITFAPQEYRGVVVTNEDNEIICGQNSNENRTYYLNFTKDYDRIRLTRY